MSTNMRSTPRTMSNFGIATRVAIFLVILLVSGLIVPFSYMASNVVFFVALLAFIVFGFKSFQGRNLLLLLYTHLLVFVSSTNTVVVIPAIHQFAANNIPGDSQTGIILVSLGIAFVFTVLVVAIPFLLIVLLLSIIVWNWYKTYDVSFRDAFVYVLSDILNLSKFSIVIEDGEKKGSSEDIEWLDIFGGPGWLIICPGQNVVLSERGILQKDGKTTRTVGPGQIRLTGKEKIKVIMLQDKVDDTQMIENILTRGGIPFEELAQQNETLNARTLMKSINPYIAGDPIHNPKLFFGREELIAKILQGIFRNHIAIQGPRRSGKSSLLIQLAQQLRNLDSAEIHFVPVLFDCHETTEADFFYDLMDALFTTLLELDPTLSLPALTFQSHNVNYTNRHFKKDIELILTTLAKRSSKKVRFILLLDEGDALNEYSSATQRKIRNLISQHRAIKMIWAGTNILTATDDPTSPWYNLQLTYKLVSLSKSEARTLITQPVVELGYAYQPEAIQRILERADGQPYIIQYLCYRAVEAMLAAQRATIILADVETAISQLDAEKSAQDPDSVVYQSRQKIEAKLAVAEKPASYNSEKKDD